MGVGLHKGVLRWSVWVVAYGHGQLVHHTGTLVLTLQIDIFLFLLLNDTAYI